MEADGVKDGDKSPKKTEVINISSITVHSGGSLQKHKILPRDFGLVYSENILVQLK